MVATWCFPTLRKRTTVKDITDNITQDITDIITSQDVEMTFTNTLQHNNDKYDIMKKKLLEGPPSVYDKHHLTERDVRQAFLSNEDMPVYSKLAFTQKTAKKIRSNYCESTQGWVDLFITTFPIFNFIRTYKKSFITADVAAGFSVGVASIPMGMSYALLAGVPPPHGLYNNIFYPLIYMIFGTGLQVCVGTSAIESMMSAQAVAKVVGFEAPLSVFLNATVGLSFFVGIMLIVMRLLQLGAAASFLADSVLSGFSTGSAITIGTSQLKYFFGLNIPRLGTPETWWFVLSHVTDINWSCVIIGIIAIVVMAAFRIINSKYCRKFPIPAPLIMLAAFALISHFMKLKAPPYNVPTIGDVSATFPEFKSFNFDKSLIRELLVQSLWYSLVLLVIHMSIAKTIAQQRGYSINANQELLALGTASLFGSFAQCFPIATSLSRSSIANMTGARTPLFNITNVMTVVLALTVITPLLHPIPMPALSTVTLFGVYAMISFTDGWKLLRLWSLDFVLWLVTCTITIFFGAMEGVVAGVGLSLLWLLMKNAFPNVAVLARLPGTTIYRNRDRFPMATEVPGCKILRFDASLNFANADQFERKVVDYAQSGNGDPYQLLSPGSTVASTQEDAAIATPDEAVKVVIIDAASINDVDVSAIRMLEVTAKKLKDQGKVLLFANWKGPTRDFLDRAKFYDVVSAEHCFLSLHDAVLWAETFYLHPAGNGATVLSSEAADLPKENNSENQTAASVSYRSLYTNCVWSSLPVLLSLGLVTAAVDSWQLIPDATAIHKSNILVPLGAVHCGSNKE